MASKDFMAPGWREILEYNGLGTFDALWQLQTDWFERPNKRRGGWSGVARIFLKTPEGGEVNVFLKRQENHLTKSLTPSIFGVPTFEREFRNIMLFRAKKLPTVEPVYFAKRREDDDVRAILITKELKDFKPLIAFDLLEKNGPLSDRKKRILLIQTVAEVVRNMHKHRLQHNCLYFKHVFVKLQNGEWDIRVIDLEKLKWRFIRDDAMIRDLYSINRRAMKLGWKVSDKIRFLKAYLREEKLSQKAKKVWRNVEAIERSKRRSARVESRA
ncbi:MAG: lipopolysaccharide kinase InaA family protein [Gammaproteobacteria bacterium]